MADPRDFEQTAMPYIDAVYRAAISLCRDRVAADDLTQATFLKALERFRTFRVGSNCRAWLLRILRNTWIDQLRHQKVVGPTVQADERLLGGDEPVEETTWNDASDLLENFGDEQIIDALSELPADQRLTLFLSDVEGLPQDEVAEIMDVAVGTVKSRAFRARAALKERLAEHARDLGFVGRMEHDA